MKDFDPQKEFNFFDVFVDYLKKYWNKFKSKPFSEIDESIIAEGRNEEEKEVLSEVCWEVDQYHQNRKDLEQSLCKSEKQTPGFWLEDKIDKNLKEQNPEITNTDIQQVKQDIMNNFETSIEAQAELLEEIRKPDNSRIIASEHFNTGSEEDCL